MFEVRPCADQDEYGRAIGAIGQYFNPPPDAERLERFPQTLPHDRMHAAFEGGEIVGGAGAFPFELSVPGGSLPCAGVTAVGVHPTHRRRGVLRAMMDAQLRDVHERGEPIAALWASEETIYGRFGYGIASWAGELRIPHEWDAFAEPFELAGTTRFVTPEEAFELFPPIYDAARRERPGMTSRSEAWWQNRQLRLPEDEASAPRRFVVLELDGVPQAYASYRTHFSFDGGSASSRLAVGEALGSTPQATAAIWRFLLDVDWMAFVELDHAPPDHPLFLLLAAPRALPDGRCPLGAARRSARRAGGSRVRRRPAARAQGARRDLSLERGTLAARRRHMRAHRRRSRPRARRLGARLRLSRRCLVRAAPRGAPGR
jgi:predicted acetyltransferase